MVVGGGPWAKWIMRQIIQMFAKTLFNIQRLILAGACLHNATCAPAGALQASLALGISWLTVLLISTVNQSAGVHNAHLFILRVGVIPFEVESLTDWWLTDQYPPSFCSWTLTCSRLWRAARGSMHRSVWAPPRWFSIVRSSARRGGINSCSRYSNVSSLYISCASPALFFLVFSWFDM